jgi:hypothetical protein
MNTLRFSLIGLLLWFVAAVTAPAANANSPGPGGGTPLAQPAFICPDLAGTDLFRSKGLEYVHTLAFAEAVATVSRGDSPFAPHPVPSGWSSAAAQWYLHLVAHDAGAAGGQLQPPRRERFPGDEPPCDPVLLHKASLEYRARPGNGKAGVVYPYYVLMGADELQERIGHIDDLSAQVASKIGLAERMGASKCSPSDVARAEMALESARRIAAAHQYDPDYAERPFLAAERLADDLVENRRIANSRGFVCHSSQ